MKNQAIFLILPVILAATVFADTTMPANKEAEQHFEKANELLKRMDYEGAIAEYSKVINLSSGSKAAQDAQYWIGQCYFKAEQFDAALTAFQKLLDEYPTSTIISSTKLIIERVQQAKDTKLLFEAIRKGDVEQVKLLFSEGSDVNEKDDKGMTPLHYAAYYGQREVAKVLIAKGANVNATDASGQTPLHLAAKFGSKYVPELLIAAGADVNARDNAGNTPLHYAAGRLGIQQDFLGLLITKSDDINARNNRGQTPLHLLPRTAKQSPNLELTINALKIGRAHV